MNGSLASGGPPRVKPPSEATTSPADAAWRPEVVLQERGDAELRAHRHVTDGVTDVADDAELKERLARTIRRPWALRWAVHHLGTTQQQGR